MENKSSALQNVTHHLVASYRELFDLAAPTMQMPAHQVFSLIRRCNDITKLHCILTMKPRHLWATLSDHLVKNASWLKDTTATFSAS